MASTFFATLAPGEGLNNYAGFMTRMSATLERIARVVVERDEKRSLATGSSEENPPAKRHNPRTSQTKQRRPTNLRTTMTPDSTPGQPTQMDISIPDALEGLPPVNSSGYMVPMSPVPDPNPTSLHETAGSVFPAPIPAWQLSHDFSEPQHPNSTTHSPDSYVSANPNPDFFQIPMSGDWDYSGNLFAGLFPTENNFPSQTEYPSMPILSAESFMNGAGIDHTAQNVGLENQMGYGYVPEEDVYQGSDSVWSNGFLGMF